MLNKAMYELGNKSSTIREIFEYGKKRALEIGEENVYDFSLGNPSVKPPKEVKETLLNLLENQSEIVLHGYTSAVGDIETRKAIAQNINEKFSVGITENQIYMTCGAAASLTITLNSLMEEGDEVIAFAPFFPEYKVFTESAGGKFVLSKPDSNLQIDINDLSNRITKNTKAIILNSPNNPSGVVYSEEIIVKVCNLLKEKSAELGKTIFLIADEPYRELVYSNVKVPYIMNYYEDTFVCYSFSKSLSLPGERIGYIAVSPKMKNWLEHYKAVCGAGRALGYVCAPSLFQRVVAKCLNVTGDIAEYKRNRDLLLNSLRCYGYTCVEPDGAFYLFVKAPNGNAYDFYEQAKKYEILVVPSDDFGLEGYVRISYCVSYERIKNSLPSFEKLAKECNLKGE